jgi:hypothetical protein
MQHILFYCDLQFPYYRIRNLDPITFPFYGKVDDNSIKEFEAIMELDPNYNIGVRSMF